MLVEFKNADFQDAVVAIDNKLSDFRNGVTNRIKASAGLILSKRNEVGNMFLLLGRLNKLNRPHPSDPAQVHNTFSVLSGNVELADGEKGVKKNIPTVFITAAREVKEESLHALKKKDILNLINRPTTQLIKNVGWDNFPSASFFVQISNEEGEKIVNIFNENIQKHPEHEISELVWVPLKGILEAQKRKEDEYDFTKRMLETERGLPFTSNEQLADESLKEIYNRNVGLPSGIKIAHYAARTIFNLKNCS